MRWSWSDENNKETNGKRFLKGTLRIRSREKYINLSETLPAKVWAPSWKIFWDSSLHEAFRSKRNRKDSFWTHPSPSRRFASAKAAKSPDIWSIESTISASRAMSILHLPICHRLNREVAAAEARGCTMYKVAIQEWTYLGNEKLLCHLFGPTTYVARSTAVACFTLYHSLCL